MKTEDKLEFLIKNINKENIHVLNMIDKVIFKLEGLNKGIVSYRINKNFEGNFILTYCERIIIDEIYNLIKKHNGKI